MVELCPARAARLRAGDKQEDFLASIRAALARPGAGGALGTAMLQAALSGFYASAGVRGSSTACTAFVAPQRSACAGTHALAAVSCFRQFALVPRPEFRGRARGIPFAGLKLFAVP